MKMLAERARFTLRVFTFRMTPDGVRLKGHFSSRRFSNKKTETSLGFFLGGEGEIRTRDRLASIPVFKTGALVHYATPPYTKRVHSNKYEARARIELAQ